VEGFSHIASPLNQLTRKYARFEWTENAKTAFQTLRRSLCDTTVLAYPDFQLPFRVKTDASDKALGAVLTQIAEGTERPVAYASRQLNQAESNYSTIKKETLAVVWAVYHFRPTYTGTTLLLSRITNLSASYVPSKSQKAG
jgi:hypothetical protein